MIYLLTNNNCFTFIEYQNKHRAQIKRVINNSEASVYWSLSRDVSMGAVADMLRYYQFYLRNIK